ncbi:DUF6191 domain-containing protein [Streptomyces sp. NPDC051310]|uniref:DUF6191 domain-containing protein n=1 Tax=Streptomyces sp. NPDC051310 TaxID=3365649 RepID=UPI0037A034E1
MEELFAPGRKHTRDEERRLALTREDLGDNDPSRGPIDLTSGRVTIRVAPPADDTAREPAPARRGASGGRSGQQVEAVGEGGRLATAGDSELGQDVGDVDARRLR